MAVIVLLFFYVCENKEIIDKKFKISIDELVDIGVTSPIIVVLNKSDLLEEKELDAIVKHLEKSDLAKNNMQTKQMEDMHDSKFSTHTSPKKQEEY